MKSLQGQLLIASPDLLDPNFLRSAVLMVEHNEEGALGLIVNRPTSTTVRQALAQLSDTLCVRDDLLYLGGPCQGALMAIHSYPLLQETEILPDVFFSGDSDNLQQLVAMEDIESIRFFVGFAGWAAGQLEAELETGSWRTTDATADLIFEGGQDLWNQLMKQVAGSALLSALNIKHVPADPSLN